MKKVTLIASLLFCTTFILNGQQSLQIVTQDSLITGDAARDGDLPAYAVVKNVSNIPVEVALKRIDANYTELTDSNAICWGLCFTPNISQNPASFNRVIQPGATDTAILHVYPDKDGFTRDGFIDYVLFDFFNPNDSVGFRINWRVDGRPLSEEEAVNPEVSVYPNPADDFLRVKYQVKIGSKNSFELINLVGSRVYQKDLDANQSEIELDLSSLTPGVYFYSLKSNGEVLMSKKLVIR